MIWRMPISSKNTEHVEVWVRLDNWAFDMLVVSYIQLDRSSVNGK